MSPIPASGFSPSTSRATSRMRSRVSFIERAREDSVGTPPSLHTGVQRGTLHTSVQRSVAPRFSGEGNDRTDLGPRPAVHRLDLGFGDRRREAATGQNSMAGSGNGGLLVARGSRRERQISG